MFKCKDGTKYFININDKEYGINITTVIDEQGKSVDIPGYSPCRKLHTVCEASKNNSHRYTDDVTPQH